MKSKKVLSLASLALPAIVVAVAFLFTGCGKSEPPKPRVYTTEGNQYVKDPAFRAGLDAFEKKGKALLKTQSELQARRNALVNATPGGEEAAKKLPEYAEIMKRGEENFKAYEANRAAMTKYVSERMRQATADTERVKRGEAVAVELPKKEVKK